MRLRLDAVTLWMLANFSVKGFTIPFGFRSTTSSTTTSSKIIPKTVLYSMSSAAANGEITEILSTPPNVSTKRLILIRHGEVINPGGNRPVYYGAMDVELSDLGKLEAQVAGSFLANTKIDKVFASPLQRAIYGAFCVLQNQDTEQKEPIILDGFTELDRGEWCGKTKGEIGSQNMARFDACDESVTPKGGESYPALKKRVLQARDQALDMLEPGQTGCIVSHLQVTRCMLSEAMGIPTNKMAQLKVATASLSCVDYKTDTKGSEVIFQSFKPEAGLATAKDGAN